MKNSKILSEFYFEHRYVLQDIFYSFKFYNDFLQVWLSFMQFCLLNIYISGGTILEYLMNIKYIGEIKKL